MQKKTIFFYISFLFYFPVFLTANNTLYIVDQHYNSILKDLRDVTGQKAVVAQKKIEDPFFLRLYLEMPFPGFTGREFNGFGGYEDPNKQIIYPLSFGFYFEQGMFTVYGLIYLPDAIQTIKILGQRQNKKLGTDYDRATLGLGTNILGVPLKFDITFASYSYHYNFQVDIPYISTFFSMGARQITNNGFQENYLLYLDEFKSDGLKKGKLLFEYLSFNSSFFKYISWGMKYNKVLETVVPELYLVYSRFLSQEKLKAIPFDFSLYTRAFQNRSSKKYDSYEVRFAFFKFFGKSSSFKYKGHDLYTLRHSIFLAVSYRNKTPDYYQDIYTKKDRPQGVGGEIGWALKLMGIENWGGKDSLFLKICFFYNYSEYYNTYPFHKYGLKMKLLF